VICKIQVQGKFVNYLKSSWPERVCLCNQLEVLRVELEVIIKIVRLSDLNWCYAALIILGNCGLPAVAVYLGHGRFR